MVPGGGFDVNGVIAKHRAEVVSTDIGAHLLALHRKVHASAELATRRPFSLTILDEPRRLGRSWLLFWTEDVGEIVTILPGAGGSVWQAGMERRMRWQC